MKWVEIEHGNKELPDWLRSAAINDDGTVFAPAALAGNEQAAFSIASWDGVPAVVNYVHVFLPTTYLAPECPQIEMLCKKSSTRFETLSQHLGKHESIMQTRQQGPRGGAGHRARPSALALLRRTTA